MAVRTEWSKVTLANNFMFRLVMDNPRFCKTLLEIILGFKIAKLTYAESEKDLKVRMSGKGIRMDLYIEDKAGIAYNIEMQTDNDARSNLARRVRYYQSLMDVDALKEGSMYRELRQSIIIVICTFDPFSDNLGKYTCNTTCRENNRIIEDGCTKIFINTKGIKDNLSCELANFMEYIESGKPQDEFTEELSGQVAIYSSDEGWGESYMRYEQMVREFKAEGEARGLAKGRAEGLAEGRAEGEAKGTLLTLWGLVKDGLLPIQVAAKRADMSEAEFKQKADALAHGVAV